MKLKKIALACAAALALPMAAHAVPPANPYDTAGAMVVFLSGASAPDNFLVSIMSGMLNPGFYQYTAGNNYRTFLGELAATSQKVVFIKRSEGGSIFGVNPIGLNSPIRTMILNQTVCPTAATASTVVNGVTISTPASCNTSGANSAIVGIDPGFPGAPGGAVPADFGVSDVAPFMFKFPLNTEYDPVTQGPAQSLVSTTNLTVRGVNTLMLGYVTTKDVPDTLKINKADYHAMLTAGVFDWNAIGAGIDTVIDKKTQVVVCRRTPGSGTQSSYNWYFNQFPCTAVSGVSGVSGDTVPSRLDASTITGGTGTTTNPFLVDVTAGYTVIENSGSGDVRTCLRSAALNLDYTFRDERGDTYRVNFGTIPVGHTNPAVVGVPGTPGVAGTFSGWRAIGVLSLDSQVNTSTTAANGGAESAWFFRAANGTGRFYSNAASQSCLEGATLSAPGAIPTGGTTAKGDCPNRTNLRSGKYDFAAELTMQYRTTVVKDSFDAARRVFIDDFIGRAGDQAFQAPWTLAVPSATSIPNGTNAISFYSRTTGGGQCGPLIRSAF